MFLRIVEGMESRGQMVEMENKITYRSSSVEEEKPCHRKSMGTLNV